MQKKSSFKHSKGRVIAQRTSPLEISGKINWLSNTNQRVGNPLPISHSVGMQQSLAHAMPPSTDSECAAYGIQDGDCGNPRRRGPRSDRGQRGTGGRVGR